MQVKLSASAVISWLLGIIVLSIAILNLFLVHPVPGLVLLVLSFFFFPPVNNWFRKNFGFSIPLIAKIILGLIIIWFTLGVSDLGDMIDKIQV